MLVRGTKDKEHAMAEALKNSIAFVGIDIGKNSFHVVGLDECGAIVLRQKWSRGQVEARFANMPPCLIGMEAYVGAHHVSRGLQKLGHDARSICRRWNQRRGKTFWFGFEKIMFRWRETVMIIIHRMAAVIFAGLVVAGAAVAQSTTPSSEKQETSCTTSSTATSGIAGEKTSNSMAMEKSAVLPDAGGSN